jgi:class 3 adenylate cyclase
MLVSSCGSLGDTSSALKAFVIRSHLGVQSGPITGAPAIPTLVVRCGSMSGTMGSSLRSRVTDVRYALVDDAHVAYRVIAGDGARGHDVVLLSIGTASMEALFEDPVAVRVLDGLAEMGRLVVFDRRGIGLSDPLPKRAEADRTPWADDIEAVVTAVGLSRPVLVSNGMGWTAAVVYCDRHRDEVTALVTLEPVGAGRPPQDGVRGQIAGEIDSVAMLCPSRAEEPGFREWFTRAGRLGASPGQAERVYPMPNDSEIREINEATLRISVPTLVLRRPASPFSPERSRDLLSALIPGAVRIDLPGEDVLVYGGEVDAFLAEVTRFVTGEYVLPVPECVLAAVLFSDVVASTERANALGGERWKRLLDRHDQTARACVGRRGGTVVKTTGDGVVATFPSAVSAIRAAQDFRAAIREEDLEVRVGLHLGDIDQRGDDISGLAVNIAARIMHLAAPDEILASNAVRLVATDATVRFEARGQHSLKGVTEPWEVFAVTSGQ